MKMFDIVKILILVIFTTFSNVFSLNIAQAISWSLKQYILVKIDLYFNTSFSISNLVDKCHSLSDNSSLNLGKH